MATVNAALTWLFDLLVAPAAGAAPLTALVAVSIATGIGMLWAIGRTSNQAGVAAAKRGIHAALFEIRLFNDNLRAVLSALGRVLWHNLRYLGHSLVPLAWAAAPLLLVVAQLQAFYGYTGLTAGEPVLLTVRLSNARTIAASDGATLVTPDGIRVDTPPVALPGSTELIWRIVPAMPGRYTVRAHIGGIELSKIVDASEGAVRRSPVRGSRLLDLLLYPSEPPLPDGSGIEAIAIPYPEPGIDVFGWRVHWMIVYVALSMITAFALATRMGVTL